GSVELLKHPASYPNEHRLQAVAVAKDGTAWVGGFTGDGGYDGVIHRYPAGGGSRETELVSAGESNQVKIWRMVADDLGNVWAAGETNARLADTHLGSYDLFLRKY